MTEQAFERRLARDLDALAEAGVRPVIPHLLAEAVVGTHPRARGIAIPFPRRGLRALLAAAVMLALVGGVIASGVLRDLLDPRLLAFVRYGDLYVAAEDGTR